MENKTYTLMHFEMSKYFENTDKIAFIKSDDEGGRGVKNLKKKLMTSFMNGP